RIRNRPSSAPFPYTTLFRSDHEQDIKRLFVIHERPEFGLPRSSVGREPAGLPREQVAGRDQTTGPRVGEHVLDLARAERLVHHEDRKSTRLNSSHVSSSYAV